MEIDKHKETRGYYNYGEMDYLTTRCSKPRKERREEVKIVEKVRENFSLGRE